MAKPLLETVQKQLKTATKTSDSWPTGRPCLPRQPLGECAEELLHVGSSGRRGLFEERRVKALSLLSGHLAGTLQVGLRAHKRHDHAMLSPESIS